MKHLVISLLFSLVMATCLAEPPAILSLPDAVFLALRYNISIKSAELDRTVQKFDLALAYHGFEPQYSLSGSTNYTNSKANGVNSITESYALTPKASLKTGLGTEVNLTMNNGFDGYNYGQSASLDITQPLLRGFGPAIAKLALFNAIDQEKIYQLSLKRLVTEQVKSVITKYRQLLLDYNSLRISKLSLQDSIDRTRRTEIEVKSGQMPGLDLLQSQASVPRQQLAVTQAENQLSQDQNDLLNLIGLQPDFKFTIPHDIEIKLVKPPSYEEAVKTALANNIDYQINKLNLKVTERALQKAEDNARWKLDLKANLGSGSIGTSGSAGSIFDGANNTRSIGLNLEIPLEKLQLNKDIAAAKINLQKAHMALAQQERSIQLEVINKLNDLKNRQQQIQLAIASRDINAKVLNAEQIKLTHGRTPVFQVNLQQRDLIESEQQIVQNQISYLNALVELQALLGTLLDEWEIKIRY